mgnify:CR=1 FL=1
MKSKKNKIYFASDFHLGDSKSFNENTKRELNIVKWLEKIKSNAKQLYLVGDIFDFWYEYNDVVPKGHYRFFSKINELIENSTDVFFITGNHDLWMNRYIEDEIGAKVRDKMQISTRNKKIFITHGDEIHNKKLSYRLIKFLFKSKFCQVLFSSLHPSIAFSIAKMWSSVSRKKNEYKSKDNHKIHDPLIKFCKRKNKISKSDFYIFGHLHAPKIKKEDEFTYVNLGDWINHNTYAVFEKDKIVLHEFIS